MALRPGARSSPAPVVTAGRRRSRHPGPRCPRRRRRSRSGRPRGRRGWRPARAAAAVGPLSSARAAIGVRQEPSRAPRNARSAVMLVMVGAWLIRASRLEHGRVVGPALDADRTLRHRRQHLLGLQRGRDHAFQAEPDQPGHGQERRLHLAGLELAQPRLHVAAQGHHDQIGSGGAQLGLAAQGGGADDGTLGQLGDAARAAGDQRVPRVGARQDGADDEPVGQRRSACPSSSGRRGRACP